MSASRLAWFVVLYALLSSLAVGCVRRTTPSKPPNASATSSDSATAEVIIDRWQVPHVRASTRAGVARGYGWAQMRAYPEEILRLYAVARGEGAVHWGKRYQPSDRMVRTLSIPQRAEAELAARSPELREHLEAFARGMNDYAQAHPERIPEPARGVLPVRPTDPLAHCHRQMISFTLLTGQRPLVISLDGETMPWVAGSNMWAIGPSRSASGNPLLLANPHLPWGPAALRIFEAHLVGPDPPLYGVTMIGFPTFLIGFNDAIAWTKTINVIDGADFFELIPDGDGYRLDGQTRAFETEPQSIHVRQYDGSLVEEHFVVRRSVHGPVVTMADGRMFAVRLAVDDDYGGVAEATLRMGRATDLPSFEAALKTLHLPLFTVGYADRDGHIFYLSAGRIPRRTTGTFASWMQPVAGDRSALIWDELMPYESLPRLVDPPSGFVQNSNSVPWFATLPPPFEQADYGLPFAPQAPLRLREIRSLRLLSEDRSISFDELRAMQRSSRVQLADIVLDDLVLAAHLDEDPVIRHAAEVLSAWDRQARADSRGTALFDRWARRTFGRRMSQTAWPWSPDDPLRTPWGLADPVAAAQELRPAALELWHHFGAVDVPWGEVARLRDDLPGVGASGEPMGSFHTVEYGPGPQGGLRPGGGDTFVALVEMTPEGPRAEVLLTYGNSSPAAPFAADQLDLLASGQLRAPLLTRAQIDSAAVESIRLE